MSFEEITSFEKGDEMYTMSYISSEKDRYARDIPLENGKKLGFIAKRLFGDNSLQVSVPSFDSIGGSVKGEANIDGNSKIEAEAHATHKGDDGSKTTGSVSISGERDSSGKISGEVKGEVRYEKEFCYLKV